MMSLNNWKIWFFYSLTIFLILFGIAKEVMLLADSNISIFFIPLLGVIFGCLLGCEYLISQYKHQGKWKIQIWKVIFIGIPSLILSFYVSIYFIPMSILPKYLESLILSEKRQIISTFSAILLGYTILTSFYKESDQ